MIEIIGSIIAVFGMFTAMGFIITALKIWNDWRSA